jgi:hypothetical protein
LPRPVSRTIAVSPALIESGTHDARSVFVASGTSLTVILSRNVQKRTATAEAKVFWFIFSKQNILPERSPLSKTRYA